ncbi:hypothetical protein GKODMF_02145 [Candidatus Electrothrix gigas]
MTNEEVLKVIEKAKAKGTTSLYLSGKQLTELPPEVGQLTNLTWLELQGNRLTSLPQEIGQLTNLQQLNLRGNRLVTLPPNIGQLENLTILYLSHNRLASLPPKIGQLTNLKRLNLTDNQLTHLPSEISKLTNLTRLELRDNQLTILPPEICQLPKLKSLYLRGNPLTSPPIEIADKGINAIRRYFVELEKSKQPLNEVKILLIGDGAAGKTSLVKQLLGQPFDEHEDTTHGISIQGWEPECAGKQIRANVWDFGGQEIQHATHQFFLSKRSLYVLVLDSRKDEQHGILAAACRDLWRGLASAGGAQQDRQQSLL